MIRAIVSLTASASMLAAALAAPMTHRHEDADHDSRHHIGRVIHAHLVQHARPFPDAPLGDAIEAADDERDARAVDLFLVAGGVSPIALGLPSALFAPPGPVAPAAFIRVVDCRSHDPPYLESLASRAPPSFSVPI